MNYMLSLKKLIFICSFTGILFTANAQNQAGTEEVLKASGKIFNAATGQPVEGISVGIPGFSSSISDSNGIFTVSVPGYLSTLVVRGYQFQTKEVSLKGDNEIEIYLYENGYNSMNKEANLYYFQVPEKFNTRSITTYYDYDNNWKNPGTSSESYFDDRIAGLNVISRSGVKGIGSNMFLRGYSSLYCTNQPLIILDGFIYDIGQYGKSVISGFNANPMANIDPDDIESVTVLKDGTSLFGAKGANGVLFIRTKHAYEMVTKIKFSAYGGINMVPQQIPVLNTDEYRLYLSDIFQTYSLSDEYIESLPFMDDSPENTDYYRYHNNTNWQDYLYNENYNQNYRLSISGGDDIALYNLSLGYQNHQGVVNNTGSQRYAFRFNSDINISQILTVNANIGVTYNEKNLSEEGNNMISNPIYLSLAKAPFTYPNVRSSLGYISPIYEDEDIFNIGNPVAVINNVNAESKDYRVLGIINGNLELSKSLKLHDLIGITYDKIKDNIFIPRLGVASVVLKNYYLGENRISHTDDRLYGFYNDLRATYTKSFNYKHNIFAIAGTRFGTDYIEGDWGQQYNTPNDEIKTLGEGEDILTTSGGYIEDWRWMTLYSGVEYNYLHKYFLSLNISLDGSSRFGDDAKGIHLMSATFGTFPSVAGAWLISSEEFMSDISFIDVLKFRASYGITGNDDIGNYSSKETYVSQNILGAWGLVKNGLWNTELKWETNKKLNMGIDLSVLKERFSISADVYSNKTEDMLNIIEPENVYSGTSLYLANAGTMETKGLDIEMNTRLINRNFKWDFSTILSKYKTEIIEFPEDERITNLYDGFILTKTGQPVGVFYGYKTLGVYSDNAQLQEYNLVQELPNTTTVPFTPGDVIFEDIDGNNIINEDDRQVIGDPNPDLRGMIINKFQFKGITLEAGLSFSYGNEIYNYLRYRLESMQDLTNQSKTVLNRWRYEGQVTDIPKVVAGDPMENSRFSDRWIEDGSYARLKFVTISYNLPIRKNIIKGIEVFISGQNLFTITKYLGADPEFSCSTFVLAQGIDIGLTPQTRSFFTGIKIGL